MKKENLKVLLLQIRDDSIVREEEWLSFARNSGLKTTQITVLNVFDRPHFEPEVVDNYDALFVGGASEASVLKPEEYPFISSCIQLLQHCEKSAKPVFASCFGFQVAVLAFGGEIIRDEANYEMGTLAISLTPEAGHDPLYQYVSEGFMAVSVHIEKAVELPQHLNVLAYTENCIHSFRVPNKPFWAFQFHPELDLTCLKERLGIYQEHYTDDSDHLQEVIDSLEETPESNLLLSSFVTEVLLKIDS